MVIFNSYVKLPKGNHKAIFQTSRKNDGEVLNPNTVHLFLGHHDQTKPTMKYGIQIDFIQLSMYKIHPHFFCLSYSKYPLVI